MPDALRASALRIPERIAIVDGEGALSYRALLEAATRHDAASHPSEFVRWIAAMHNAPAEDEHRAAAKVRDDGRPLVLSHRELLLRALHIAVVHPAFDRDGCIALSLPLATPLGAAAAALSIVLGSSLRMLGDAKLPKIASGIASAEFQAWVLGPSHYAELEDAAQLPAPTGQFRIALCQTPVPPCVKSRLVAWLGDERVRE